MPPIETESVCQLSLIPESLLSMINFAIGAATASTKGNKKNSI